jgi:hypothetical protein
VPDISMCQDKDCPFKEGCYRYTAKPSEWQSWFSESPRKGDKCEMYWGSESESIYTYLKDITQGKIK